MLGGLDKEYGIAVRFFVRNIPQGMKDVADFALQTKIDADLSAQQLARSGDGRGLCGIAAEEHEEVGVHAD